MKKTILFGAVVYTLNVFEANGMDNPFGSRTDSLPYAPDMFDVSLSDNILGELSILADWCTEESFLRQHSRVLLHPQMNHFLNH